MQAADFVSYQLEDFTHKYTVHPVFRTLFSWDCSSDCNYKCQQFITNKREQQGLPMVQFYGKWPFHRVWGITELFLTLFSLGNLYINWHNIHKVLKQHNKQKKHNPSLATMYKQYLLLLGVLVFGWVFSTLFHIRDNAVTETLDYFGAAAIIVANFNAITVRYFELFREERQKTRRLFQFALALVWLFHCYHLKTAWDYTYNMAFNIVIGISALVLWILHSLRITLIYSKNEFVFSNSIQLLPFETKILTKLNHVWILPISKTRFIPMIPIVLNLWLLSGMTFEITDFEPWRRLVDGHAIWHLFTIFPVVIWYDWNIWDLELYTVNSKH